MTAAVQRTAATISFIMVPPERITTDLTQMNADKTSAGFGPALLNHLLGGQGPSDDGENQRGVTGRRRTTTRRCS